MSECVVRMEIPENCEACHLRINDSPTNVPNWICAINQWPTFYCRKSQNHANEDKYLHDCPILCQLPEGHGRLIDASYVIDVIQDELDNDVPITVDDCFQIGCKIPTIVPAEAERSEHERTD